MAHKILRLPDVIDRVGFSRSTIYAFVSGGYFPPPIKIGPRAVGWLDVNAGANLHQFAGAIVQRFG